MLRFPCLVAAVALSAACVSQQMWWQQDLQEWEGAPVSELLDAWGPPLRTQTGEDESAVLVYERIRQLDHRLEELRIPARASARTPPQALFRRWIRASAPCTSKLRPSMSSRCATKAAHVTSCRGIPRGGALTLSLPGVAERAAR
jgi:hypothetical protein